MKGNCPLRRIFSLPPLFSLECPKPPKRQEREREKNVESPIDAKTTLQHVRGLKKRINSTGERTSSAHHVSQSAPKNIHFRLRREDRESPREQKRKNDRKDIPSLEEQNFQTRSQESTNKFEQITQIQAVKAKVERVRVAAIALQCNIPARSLRNINLIPFHFTYQLEPKLVSEETKMEKLILTNR